MPSDQSIAKCPVLLPLSARGGCCCFAILNQGINKVKDMLCDQLKRVVCCDDK